MNTCIHPVLIFNRLFLYKSYKTLVIFSFPLKDKHISWRMLVVLLCIDFLRHILIKLLICSVQLSSVQSLSCVRFFAIPWIAAHQASLSITSSQSLLKLMSIKLVRPSSHFILCRPLLLLPPISPSIRVFSNESTLLMRWPKYWSFIFSIRPSNEHPALNSFRMDWLDLLAVQGTLKSLLQHHSSKASILRCSIVYIVLSVSEMSKLILQEVT